MEDTDLLKMAGLSTSGVAILLIAWRFLKSLQGKKLVSSCCGHKGEMGMVVVNMTPTPVKGACPPTLADPRSVPELALRVPATATPSIATSS